MLSLFLSELDIEGDSSGEETDIACRWLSLLNELESILFSLITTCRSEARLWLCNTVSDIRSFSPHQQRDVFMGLLETATAKRNLASQVLQMLFEKRPERAGAILAKKCHVLEKFFQGERMRILHWFSNAADGGSRQKSGAKALFHFAFVNRDHCWEELVWNGKHGQSPAVVAAKPHYMLDLDIERTVENFLDYVPQFWSSSEFAESLKDGDIISIDTNFFIDLFVDMMYRKDSRDVWNIVQEFIMEESFSHLCRRLLITFNEDELCTALDLLSKQLNLSPIGPHRSSSSSSSSWLEVILSNSDGCNSIDQLLLLSAVVKNKRQVSRLVHDEEFTEELESIKDTVSNICTISGSSHSLRPILNECFKMDITKAIKFLGIQSWVIHFVLSEECQSPASWESLFSHNCIGFRRYDKYEFLKESVSKTNNSKLDDKSSNMRRKKKKRKKKNDNNDDDYEDYYAYIECDILGDDRHSSQTSFANWFLSTDRFSAVWNIADLPEHLSSHCFSTWMICALHRWSSVA